MTANQESMHHWKLILRYPAVKLVSWLHYKGNQFSLYFSIKIKIKNRNVSNLTKIKVSAWLDTTPRQQKMLFLQVCLIKRSFKVT